MLKVYWKKRNIPNKCPACGVGEFVMPKPSIRHEDEETGEIYYTHSFTEMLNAYIGPYWKKSFWKKHPFWRIPCHYGECMKCEWSNQIQANYDDWQFVKTNHKNEWKGGTLITPLSHERKNP